MESNDCVLPWRRITPNKCILMDIFSTNEDDGYDNAGNHCANRGGYLAEFPHCFDLEAYFGFREASETGQGEVLHCVGQYSICPLLYTVVRY